MSEIEKAMNGLNYVLGILDGALSGGQPNDVRDQIRSVCNVHIQNAGKVVEGLKLEVAKVGVERNNILHNTNEQLNELANKVEERDDIIRELQERIKTLEKQIHEREEEIKAPPPTWEVSEDD